MNRATTILIFCVAVLLGLGMVALYSASMNMELAKSAVGSSFLQATIGLVRAGPGGLRSGGGGGLSALEKNGALDFGLFRFAPRVGFRAARSAMRPRRGGAAAGRWGAPLDWDSLLFPLAAFPAVGTGQTGADYFFGGILRTTATANGYIQKRIGDTGRGHFGNSPVNLRRTGPRMHHTARGGGRNHARGGGCPFVVSHPSRCWRPWASWLIPSSTIRCG